MTNAGAATHYLFAEGFRKLFRGVKARGLIRKEIRELKTEHKEIKKILKEGKGADLKGVHKEANRFIDNASKFTDNFFKLAEIENIMAQEEIEVEEEFNNTEKQLRKVGCTKSELKDESEKMIKVLLHFKSAFKHQREICAFMEKEVGQVIENSQKAA